MDVLKFRIYVVTIDDKNKDESNIAAEASTKFKRNIEKYYLRESSVYLLPDKQIDEFILKIQQEETEKYVRDTIIKRFSN